MLFDVYEIRFFGSGDFCLGVLFLNSVSKIGFFLDYFIKDGDRMVLGYLR